MVCRIVGAAAAGGRALCAFALRLQVAADGLVAAAITQLDDFPGEPGGIRASVTEAVV